MLAVPHQQALPGGVLPPVGGLVLAQRVHAVVAVDVGVQKLYAVGKHCVAQAHRDAVDVGAHGGLGRNAVGAQQRAGFAQAAGVDAGVGEVAEIQVVGRKPDAPCPHSGKQGLGLGGGGGL